MSQGGTPRRASRPAIDSFERRYNRRTMELRTIASRRKLLIAGGALPLAAAIVVWPWDLIPMVMMLSILFGAIFLISRPLSGGSRACGWVSVGRSSERSP